VDWARQSETEVGEMSSWRVPAEIPDHSTLHLIEAVEGRITAEVELHSAGMSALFERTEG